MENKSENFTSSYADVSDALYKLEERLQEEIAKDSYRKNDDTLQEYKKDFVYPILKMQGVAKEKFRNKYELYEAFKQIEETEKQRNKVMDLLRKLEEKPLASNVASRIPNWKPRGTSFLNTMKKTVNRARSRSLGGKRKRKTQRRKHK